MASVRAVRAANRPRLEIELALANGARSEAQVVVRRLHKLLHAAGKTLRAGTVDLPTLGLSSEDLEDVISLRLGEPERSDDDEDDTVSAANSLGAAHGGEETVFSYREVDEHWLVYQPCSDGPSNMTVSALGGDEGGGDAQGGGDNPAYSQLSLPAIETEGLWESLVLEPSIKRTLLAFSASSLLFGTRGVDSNLVSANKVILLHGPPGTGKTTLCKALAHKLAIRASGRYPTSLLVEINAHSLFSRWFSESGKMVSKLFAHLRDIVDSEEAFCFLLIDEVESLVGARTAALKGGEPGDAVRAVNAVLTAIDQFRASRPNVLVLCTSNVTEAIDVAFLDRADVRLYIGPPPEAARFTILQSALAELVRCGIAVPCADASATASATQAGAGSTSSLTSTPSSASAATYSTSTSTSSSSVVGSTAGASSSGGSSGKARLAALAAGIASGNAHASLKLLDKVEAALALTDGSTPTPSAPSARHLRLVPTPRGRALVKEALAAFRDVDGTFSQAQRTGAASAPIPVASAVVPGIFYSSAAQKAVFTASVAASEAEGPAVLSEADVVSLLLAATARATEGFSGRSLRKLPLQAHARFVRTGLGKGPSGGGGSPVVRVADSFARYAVWEAESRELDRARNSSAAPIAAPPKGGADPFRDSNEL